MANRLAKLTLSVSSVEEPTPYVNVFHGEVVSQDSDLKTKEVRLSKCVLYESWNLTYHYEAVDILVIFYKKLLYSYCKVSRLPQRASFFAPNL